MANIFDSLYRIALIILYIVLFLILVAGIGVYIYLRSRKKRRIAKKNIDYSSFDRKDSKSYIGFIDDIKDDMIIMDNMTRFVAAVECQGFDFYSENIVAQKNTAQNYLGFINIIDRPISYRQSSKSIDLEYTINKYLKAYDNVCEKYENAQKRLTEIQNAMKKELSPEKDGIYRMELEKTIRQAEALAFRKFHLESQLNYINNNIGTASAPLRTSLYIFDWVYNPMDFPMDLSESEILERAKNELAAQANAMINSLSNCGVKAKRCATEQLIDICRRHSQPISSERFTIKDVYNSSYFDDITTTDSLSKMQEKARDKLLNDASLKFDEELNELIAESNEINNSMSAGKAEGDKND